jgi:hypothetical protein
MGRSKKNKRQDNNGDNRQEGSNKKMRTNTHNKQRGPREWIIDCVDSPKGGTYDIELLVRRSVLTDAYGKTIRKVADETDKEIISSKVHQSNEKPPHIISLDPISDTNLEESSQAVPTSTAASKKDSGSTKVCIKKANNAKKPMPKVRTATIANFL